MRVGSAVVAHRLSCSMGCGIFRDQGSNLCPLHRHCTTREVLAYSQYPMYLSDFENITESVKFQQPFPTLLDSDAIHICYYKQAWN